MSMDSIGGMKGEAKPKAKVVVLSYPATGHTYPMLQFSKNLTSRGLLVTFVTFNVNHHQVIQAKQSVDRLKLNIRFECIPDGFSKDHPPDSDTSPFRFKHMMDMTGDPGLEPLIHRLNADAGSPPVCCIVYNSFLPWARRVANKIKIPHALFWTQSATVFSLYHRFGNDEVWDSSRMPESVQFAGLPELKLGDLPGVFRETTGILNYFLRQLDGIKDASWVLANTVYELEPRIIDFIRSRSIPFRAIGPSIPWAFLDEHNKDDTEVGANPWNEADCISWLDDKPPQSVVYISFGSITVIKPEQIRELALGIQRSHRNCVWVIRPPPGHGHIEELLPAGFLEETKQRVLVMDWCDQLKVLSHPSVGAFMSHCGWNSTLDALSLGVPILAFGIWTDQPTNSKWITDVWKNGVRVQRREDGSIGWEEVERCMRMVVGSEEGKEVRNNALKWRERVRAAAREGGSSHTNLDEFAQEILFRSHSLRNVDK